MAIIRVNVKDHYGEGEIWSDAENETAALQEVREWCDRNSPWEVTGSGPARGGDGHYRFALAREIRAGAA